MKQFLFFSLFLILFCNLTFADSLINSSVKDLKSPVHGKYWFIEGDGYKEYNCQTGSSTESAAYMISVIIHNGPSENSSVTLICNGINGLSQEDINLGQSSQLCTLTCATNNTQYIKWYADNASLGSSGLLFSKTTGK